MYIINIKLYHSFLQDSRYTDEVDRITGYKADSLLCMPIRNADDDIVGVAQVINKNSTQGIPFRLLS
jgi:hypothetical protein